MTSTIAPHPLAEKLNQSLRKVSSEEVSQYKTEGYVLLKNVVTPEMAAQWYAEVMDIMEVVGLGHTKLRQTAQYLHGTFMEGLIQGDYLRGVAAALMESPAHLYMPFTAVKSGGGGGRFHYHQDGNYTRFTAGQGINLWFALVPMREENGGLKMVPRSHVKGEVASENAGDGDSHKKVAGGEPADAVLIEMEPGDCVAFGRWTVHGSGPNNTPEHRVAYAVQFHSEDAVAPFDGGLHLLRENPRWKDIWGCDEILADRAGKRDGH